VLQGSGVERIDPLNFLAGQKVKGQGHRDGGILWRHPAQLVLHGNGIRKKLMTDSFLSHRRHSSSSTSSFSHFLYIPWKSRNICFHPHHPHPRAMCTKHTVQAVRVANQRRMQARPNGFSPAVHSCVRQWPSDL